MSNWMAGYIDAWNSHDAATVGQFIAEDATFEDPATNKIYRGREAIIEHFEAAHNVSDDFRLVLVNGQQSDYGFAIEWEMTGTQTGEQIRVRGVSVGRLDPTGQIGFNRDYFNMADLMSRLGIGPAPGA